MNPREFAIVPAEGAVGPVRIGMTRDQVRAALGPGQDEGERECYLDCFFVEYDEKGRVDFIELGNTTRFRVTLQGTPLLEVPPEEALAQLATLAPYDPEDPELGCIYFYPDLLLTLWRHFDDPDVSFETVSLGSAAYYA